MFKFVKEMSAILPYGVKVNNLLSMLHINTCVYLSLLLCKMEPAQRRKNITLVTGVTYAYPC